ncbi:smg-9, nonsense mediated mRNA decay factor [Thoreauomyces humboldtii]|nr:smg-9, nonsense mediated mRNA decay factor [Thoreauomyces humboldtii]
MPTGLLLRKPTPDLSAATRPDTFGSRLATRPSDRAKSEPTGLEAPSAVRDGQHPASQTGSPSSVHKILDHQQRFQLSEPAHRALSDLPGCFIVGILGCKRVGKSTILSHLASNPSLFSPRTPTTGIDLHVTPERVVLLDTQSLYIGAGPQPRSELVHSIRMATFVMAVCHVILVVGDDAPDQNLMTFLRRVETVRHRLLPIAPREEARDRCPVISYVATKCKGGAFATDNYQAVAHVVSESLKGMRIRMTGGPSLEVAFPYYRASPALEDPSIAPVTSPNVFLLPVAPSVAKHKRITLQDLMIDRGVPARFEMMLKHLRNQVFVTSRTPSAERPGWRAWFGISEREWLKGAARSWEILRKADVAGEWIRAGKG